MRPVAFFSFPGKYTFVLFLYNKTKKILLAQAIQLFTSKVDAMLRNFLVVISEF